MKYRIGPHGYTISCIGLFNCALLVWASTQNTGLQLICIEWVALAGASASAWVFFDDRFKAMSPTFIFGLALLLRLIAIQSTPLLEDDYFRYLWDGYRTATSFDPYRFPPSAFFTDTNFSAHWQNILSGINYPDIPTIYGPVLQYLFALAYWIAPGQVIGIQSIVLLIDMVLMAILLRQGVRAKWLLIYAISPLVLKEAMASAHPDGLISLFLVMATVAWRQGHAAWVGTLVGLAVATKVSGLLVLPIFLIAARNQRPILWGAQVFVYFLISLVVCYAPFIWASGFSDFIALGIFGNTWRFNPLVFRFLELFFSNLARPLAGGAVVLAVGMIAWRSYQQHRLLKTLWIPPLDLVLLTLLLLSPVVNPWYWLWVLPLGAFHYRSTTVVAACVAMVSYINSQVLRESGFAPKTATMVDFTVPWLLTIFQLVAIFIAAWFEWGLPNLRPNRSLEIR